MKKSLISLFLLLLIFLSCEKDDNFDNRDCPTEHFYYTYAEKYYIDSILQNDYLLIGFKGTYSIEEIDEFLDETQSFNNDNLNVRSDSSNILIIRKFKETKTCLEISNIIYELQRDNRVDFAAYTYTGEFCIGFDCTELMSYANEFVVKLNDTLQFDSVQALCLSTDTWILEKKKRGRYLIGVDKNSQGNAMEMANSFYESGIFEYSHPNFHYFNIE
ncbi:MAG: hypothetical protein JXA77_14850 [Bacteroidales bacterium]|nr:hypothetical protein [Bacteroidales bacterium]MBN2818630.1 hypothetical protein [Bacteroidales bacterium]